MMELYIAITLIIALTSFAGVAIWGGLYMGNDWERTWIRNALIASSMRTTRTSDQRN